MKKLEKLKLSNLNNDSLDTRLQNALKGGATCYCSCSGCSCSSWDGKGSMPPTQSSSDEGTGSVNGASASNRESWL